MRSGGKYCRRELAAEVRGEHCHLELVVEETRRLEATDIKSNNPHLTGGEVTQVSLLYDFGFGKSHDKATKKKCILCNYIYISFVQVT